MSVRPRLNYMLTSPTNSRYVNDSAAPPLSHTFPLRQRMIQITWLLQLQPAQMHALGASSTKHDKPAKPWSSIGQATLFTRSIGQQCPVHRLLDTTSRKQMRACSLAPRLPCRQSLLARSTMMMISASDLMLQNLEVRPWALLPTSKGLECRPRSNGPRE